MKFGVVTFPGSNCDYDTYAAIRHVLGGKVEFLWHLEADLKDCDIVILPGGFSYGDYLRTGAIARFAPIMREVISFAGRGGLVWGICNGFQILLEAGLLPGAMLRNKGLRFVCRQVYIRVETTATPLTGGLAAGQVLKIPIAHSDGNYYDYPEKIKELEDNDQVLFRYCDREGRISEQANPNGSAGNIAGICNRGRNVFGLMPHPERAVEKILNSEDGLSLFQSIQAYTIRRAG